jgi:hypothetical protein
LLPDILEGLAWLGLLLDLGLGRKVGKDSNHGFSVVARFSGGAGVAWFLAGFGARVKRLARTLIMGSSVVARLSGGAADVASFLAGFGARVATLAMTSTMGTFWRGWHGLDGRWIRGKGHKVSKDSNRR